ncbi:MAG: hypothetical protein U0572_17030 [Phycisphaerales bacterium]
MTRLGALATTTLASLIIAVPALADGAYDLSWNSIDGGGVMFAAGSDYVLGGTIGQADAGIPLVGGDYELVGGFWSVPASLPAPCVADLDGSGAVDAADLGRLLGNWGGSGVGDIDGSGAVNAGDLAILLGAWGPC